MGLLLSLTIMQKDKFEMLKNNLKDYGFEFGRCVKREGAYILKTRKSDILTGNDNAALVRKPGFIS